MTHFDNTETFAKVKEQRNLRVVHADKLEDNFLFKDSTEIYFLYVFVDDIVCAMNYVGYPKSARNEPFIGDVNSVVFSGNRTLP